MQDITGMYLYIIRVRMVGSTMSALLVLSHETKFTQEKVDEMVAEAAKITNEVRIPKTRQDLADRKQAIINPNKPGTPAEQVESLNEWFFDGDEKFFEGVLMDKFGFKVAHYITTSTEIEPTILTKK